MLKRIISEKLLKASGILGFYPAHSDGDDILVYESEDDTAKAKHVLYGLRQQAEIDSQVRRAIYNVSDEVGPVYVLFRSFSGVLHVHVRLHRSEVERQNGLHRSLRRLLRLRLRGTLQDVRDCRSYDADISPPFRALSRVPFCNSDFSLVPTL